ncbi:transposable element Tcb1 transposase [Trichonephila clavipes]|nr:transposable element Tcb1 transposase [Trichonephila clavipes]
MECAQGIHCFVYPSLETARVCATNDAMNGGYGQRNEMTLCLLTNPASACNIMMVGLQFGDTVERRSCIMIWSGIGFHCRNPLVRIADTLNSERYIFEVLEPLVFPYIQRLPSAIFQQDNARLHMVRNVQEFLFTHQTKLLNWPACSTDLSPFVNV